MITCLQWLPDPKSFPSAPNLRGNEETNQQNINIDNEDNGEDPLKDLNMNDYDQEDEFPAFTIDSKATRDLMFYKSNTEDPYMDKEEDEDLSDLEDLIIRETDALLLSGNGEDDASHLEVCVYEENEQNIYIHHDIFLTAFPLCLTWLNTSATQSSSCLAAVGTFHPEIEIWDASLVNAVEPVSILGGPLEAPNRGTKKKKKNQPMKPGSHLGAVLGLAANQHASHILASCSADNTVKAWDLNKAECIHTLSHHTDKVQTIRWHPTESTVILSGSFDKSVAVLDGRYPQAASKWNTTAEVESVQWNPHNTQTFTVSLEDGNLSYYDIRKQQDAIWKIAAHTKATSGIAFNPVIPNLLATCSTDKTLKFWDLKGAQPMCFKTSALPFSMFGIDFYPKSPLLLAVGGKNPQGSGEINDRLRILNLAEMPEMSKLVKTV